MIPLTKEDVEGFSSGLVRTPSSYNYRTWLPETGGLYSVEVFGAVPWKAGDRPNFDEDRRDKWGHIVLVRSVEHPELKHSFQYLPVVPPRLRHFVVISREARIQSDRARRKFLTEDPDRTYRLYAETVETMLAEEGLDDVAAIENPGEGPFFEEPALNIRYRSVVNRNNRLARLLELDAPANVVRDEQAGLQDAVRQLFAAIRESSTGWSEQETLRARALRRTSRARSGSLREP